MKRTTHTQQTEAQSVDEILALLSDDRRRHAVAVLGERDVPTTVRDLAAEVAVREADQDGAPTAAIDEIAADLHHGHLPKLDAAGVVDYDAETTTVTDVRPEALSTFSEAREAEPSLLF